MPSRLSTSVGLSTIISTIVKLGSLYHFDFEHGEDWIAHKMDSVDFSVILLSLFLIFFEAR